MKNKIYEDGYDDNYYGDDNDYEYLLSLPDIEKEKILNDRRQKRQELKRIKEIEKNNSKVLDPRLLIQNSLEKNFESEKNMNNNKIYELKNNYELKQNNDEKKRKIKIRIDISSVEDLEKLNFITLKRDYLLKIFSHINFETAVLNCLIKISSPDNNINDANANYILCLIIGIIECKPYEYNKKKINKKLVILFNNEEKLLNFNNISNKKIDEKEIKLFLENYIKYYTKENSIKINRRWIENKLEDLNKLKNYKYDLDDIKKINEKIYKEENISNNQKLKALENKLSMLEYDNFQVFEKDRANQIREIKIEINNLRNMIHQAIKTSDTKKERALLKFDELNDNEKIVFKSTHSRPVNLWSMNDESFNKNNNTQNKINIDANVNKAKEIIEETQIPEKELFFKIFNRDLSNIDQIVDSLNVNIENY